ncbi:DUF423 domain-containing protein [Sphingopyxis indica]|uniref:DUF423 domain-containing protein n=1 Tax=Sphingopyxis indica TaxID=436663 RepID=UPI0029391500|nr:DUF423 domain-containing protein [Sphingopyxis indica]WOF43291.1 DUF423 domain-containing protein [Sphingopyxis indica]
MGIWIWTNLGPRATHTENFRLAAQIQFIHAMTCFASATFMNLGALKARHAPGFFLSGAGLLSGSLYLNPFLKGSFLLLMGGMGSLCLLGGWLTLILSATDIDRDKF